MKPAASWPALCALFAALTLLVWPFPRELLDWQPALALAQPWRALSAAFVHWTPLHLAANLAGCAVLAMLGWRARLGGREALAGLAALPLAQLGLLLRPELAHYAGLSGALHGLTAVAALALLAGAGRGPRERLVGAAIVAGLVAKLVLERPLGPVLQTGAGWDFAVAPFAHLSGTLAGALAWALTIARFHRTPRSPHGT